MKKHNLTVNLVTDRDPEEVFEFIKNVRGWWSEEIEGNAEKEGDEFTYRYKDLHYSKQKITQVIPFQKITWLVTDSRLSFVEEKNEWSNTRILFDISRQGKKTHIKFTHEGITPEKECFDACTGGWNHYLQDSLMKLISTGKGNPAKKETQKI